LVISWREERRFRQDGQAFAAVSLVG